MGQMTDRTLEYGKLGGGKNNKANRKMYKARENSHIRRLPSIDLHKDANGKRYDRQNLNGREILSQQIGALQDYLWKVLEDPDVNTPFVVVHGEGNSYTLRDITIGLCELRGFKVFEGLHRIHQGYTIFQMAPLGEDKLVPDYYVEEEKDGTKKYFVNGVPFSALFDDQLRKSELWDKDCDWSIEEDRMFYILRHVYEVSSGEWEKNSDINGTPLNLGALVQIHPQMFEEATTDDGKQTTNIIAVEEIHKSECGRWKTQTQTFVEADSVDRPFLVIDLLSDIQVDERPDKINTAIVQAVGDSTRIPLPTHALRFLSGTTNDGTILP